MPKGPLGISRVTSTGVFVDSDTEYCKPSDEAVELFKYIFDKLYIDQLKFMYATYPDYMNEFMSSGRTEFLDQDDYIYIEQREGDILHDVINSVEHNSGIEFVAKGTNRTIWKRSNVIGRPTCVIKIPYFGITPEGYTNYGILDTVQEYHNYHNIPGRYSHYLLPVADIDEYYRWETMPYARPDPDSFKEFMDHLQGNNIDPLDLHPDNVGKYKGDLVMIDYGDEIVVNGSPLFDYQEVKSERDMIVQDLMSKEMEK